MKKQTKAKSAAKTKKPRRSEEPQYPLGYGEPPTQVPVPFTGTIDKFVVPAPGAMVNPPPTEDAPPLQLGPQAETTGKPIFPERLKFSINLGNSEYPVVRHGTVVRPHDTPNFFWVLVDGEDIYRNVHRSALHLLWQT